MRDSKDSTEQSQTCKDIEARIDIQINGALRNQISLKIGAGRKKEGREGGREEGRGEAKL